MGGDVVSMRLTCVPTPYHIHLPFQQPDQTSRYTLPTAQRIHPSHRNTRLTLRGVHPIPRQLRATSHQPHPTSPSFSDLFRESTGSMPTQCSPWNTDTDRRIESELGRSMDNVTVMDPRNKSEDDGCVGGGMVSMRLTCVSTTRPTYAAFDYTHPTSPSFSDLFRESTGSGPADAREWTAQRIHPSHRNTRLTLRDILPSSRQLRAASCNACATFYPPHPTSPSPSDLFRGSTDTAYENKETP